MAGKILVLDANQRSALAIIRSLGQRGLTVYAGDQVARPLGAASRYAASSILYPDPAHSASAFINEIIAITRRLEVDTIFPATDLTTMLLTSQRELRELAHVVTPDARSYEALTDKAHLTTLADELGVLTPETRLAKSTGEIEKIAKELGYPVVLKPARSCYLVDDKVVPTGVLTVNSPAKLTDTLRQLTWIEDIPCLVQRFIAGAGAGIFALRGTEDIIAWFAHRRLREKPPTGGVSVLSESAPINSIMQDAAQRLLGAVSWVGVAMVEFRVASDNTPYLMEVNGRFWGSLQLAIDCGVDFPWLLYQETHGMRPVSPNSYRIGRRLRWLLGDFDSLLLKLRQSEATPGDRIRAVASFVQSFVDPFGRQEILRLSDPCPGIRELSHWIKALSRP